MLGPDLKGRLVERIQGARLACEESTKSGAPIFDTLRDHAHAIDDVIRDVARARMESDPEIDPERNALIALGGYGREELNLHSDIDLLFLVNDPLKPAEIKALPDIEQYLWDIGLTPGIVTRNIKECLNSAGNDLESATSLIDNRLIWGGAELRREMVASFTKRLRHDKRDWFLRLKRHEWEGRHHRHGDSVFKLEPNLKENEGGLRDYHATTWLLFVVYGNSNLSELTSREILTLDEYNKMLTAIEHLLRLRNWMHIIEDDKKDVLSFELQSKLAKRLGLSADNYRMPEERLMHQYYHHSSALHRLAGSAIGQLTLRPERGSWLFKQFSKRSAGAGMWISGGALSSVEPPDEWLRESPDRLMRVFETVAEKRVRLGESLRKAITRVVGEIDREAFQRSTVVRMAFLKILGDRGWVWPTMREMYETGVLNAYVPEFDHLYCMPQLDRYHHYTVDEHTLRTFHFSDMLWGRQTEANPGRNSLMGRMRRAASKVARWELLNLGLLLHDVGKGLGSGHAIRGAQMAHRFCERIGLGEAETDIVHFLVIKHLRMFHIAMRRNIQDPSVIERFAREVGSKERLQMLHTLTFCDLSAVGPDNWTEWKGRQLQDLYDYTLKYFEDGAVPSLDESAIGEEWIDEICERLGMNERDQRQEVEQFANNLPKEYALHYGPSMAADHLRLLKDIRDDQKIAWLQRKHEETQTTEVVVCAEDNTGLFELICGGFAFKRVNIHGVHIFSTPDGFALDVFYVTDLNGNPLPDDYYLDSVKKRLNDILAGKKMLEDLASQIPSMPPPAHTVGVKQPMVLVDNEADSSFSVVEMKAYDQPGTLYRIARALSGHGLDIHIMQTIPEAFRVVAVMYVTDVDSQKLDKKNDVNRLLKRLENELGYAFELDLKNSRGLT